MNETIIKEIKLTDIILEEALQIRDNISQERVSEYTEIFDDLPPPILGVDRCNVLRIIDGNHRIQAAKQLKKKMIRAEIRKATYNEMLFLAFEANSKCGLPLTTKEKRRAVEKVLKMEEFTKFSDREIAKRLGVSQALVSKIRNEISSDNRDQMSPTKKTITRRGKTYEMDTTKIGKLNKNSSLDGDISIQPTENEHQYDKLQLKKEIEIPSLSLEDAQRVYTKPVLDGMFVEVSRPAIEIPDLIETAKKIIKPGGYLGISMSVQDFKDYLQVSNKEKYYPCGLQHVFAAVNEEAQMGDSTDKIITSWKPIVVFKVEHFSFPGLPAYDVIKWKKSKERLEQVFEAIFESKEERKVIAINISPKISPNF